MLIVKGSCYALERSDGSSWWLEMDLIPQHLIDRPVRIEGQRFEPNLISVHMIAPG